MSASPRPTSAATPEPEVMEAEDAGLWVNEAISDHPPADGKPTPEPTPLPTPRTGRTVASDVRYTMDFDQLEQVNEDVRGWLICEGTSINYPVAQAENNTYYLEHLFTGGENRTGAIFMDCGSSPTYAPGSRAITARMTPCSLSCPPTWSRRFTRSIRLCIC